MSENNFNITNKNTTTAPSNQHRTLLYELRRHVLKRDNYRCQKCGVSLMYGWMKDNMIKSIRRDYYNIDVYDWATVTRLMGVRTRGCGHDSNPERYITWCKKCADLDLVENFEIDTIECPIHHDDFDACSDSNCLNTTHNCKTIFWLNQLDLMTLRELAQYEGKPARELITEAIQDLFAKYDKIEEQRDSMK